MSDLRLHRSAFRLARYRTLMRSGLPFVGYQITLQVRGEIDRLLLALLSGQAVVGWYFAAFRIINIPVFIPTMITTPLLPALSRHADDLPVFQQTLRKTVVIALLTNVPIAAVIIAIAPAVPGLLGWPEEFRHAIPLMMILAVQQPLVALDMVLGTALMARNDERRWLHVALVASVFNPTLNLILIPFFQRTTENGAVAAAIVTVLTELVILAGAFILLPKGMVDRGTLLMGGRVLLAGLCLWAVAAILHPMFVPLAVATGGLVYLAAILVLRVITPDEIRSLRNMAGGVVGRRRARANS
jgi:O-antigen/teichoic acid export membrane protein